MPPIRKPLTLPEDVAQGPLAPQIAARLSHAQTRRTALRAECDAGALDAELGDVAALQRQRALQDDLDGLDAEIRRLAAALEEARRRDRRALEAAELAEMRAGLAEFKKLIEARATAARDLDAAVTALGDAFYRLRAAGQLIPAMTPANLRLPAGFLGRDVRKMVGHLLHKASAVSSIGDVSIPGSASPDHKSTYDCAAIPSAAVVICDENNWLVGSLEVQIEAIAKGMTEAA